MEKWIGSVHSKMAWQTHFFFFFWRLSHFGKELFIHIYIYIYIYIYTHTHTHTCTHTVYILKICINIYLYYKYFIYKHTRFLKYIHMHGHCIYIYTHNKLTLCKQKLILDAINHLTAHIYTYFCEILYVCMYVCMWVHPSHFRKYFIIFFTWQHWRNDTLLQCKVMSVQLV